MNIGEAATATGISAKMIRYYEDTGVIGAPLRTLSGYRVYQDKDIQTLHFVRRARDLGFTVKQIEDLLALWRDRTRASADVKRIAKVHVAELQKKMLELQEMIGTLEHLSRTCHGDERPDCPILTTLGSDTGQEAIPKKKKSALGKGFEAHR
ncbi:Cu(I)-responsive transcriptional regulator [Tabrizicola sp. BL-A-41-H6]|uniref:Cu(I)-responsive transcriptional regulator n=1 Tax=Tabrizicola sp. BL-A-41-H6 TaxID=3421107 RepID=UPI003D6766A4